MWPSNLTELYCDRLWPKAVPEFEPNQTTRTGGSGRLVPICSTLAYEAFQASAAIFNLDAGMTSESHYVNSLVAWDISLVPNSQMINGIRGFLTTVLVLALPGSAYSDPLTYQQEFVEEVIIVGNLNRLNMARLHRDIHANCYILVTLATIILSDGSVRDVSIVKSSTVPVVDRYFLYIIELASPYQPLANHYDPVPEEVTITHEFKLDAQLWGHGIRSTRPCEELNPRDSQPD